MELELSNGHAHGDTMGEHQVQEQGRGSAEQQAPAPALEQDGQGVPCSGAEEEAELLWMLRKYLMLLAILVAAITFQAGLTPPGGFWQERQGGYLAGDVVLRASYPRRYHVFFYCNTTAFGASLIVLILLLVRPLSRNPIWLRSLQTAMVLALLGLMGAYAAGSCREVRTSLYIWALMVGIFAYITLHVVFFRHLAPQCLKDVLYGIRDRWKETLGSIFEKKEEKKKKEEERKKKEEEEKKKGEEEILSQKKKEEEKKKKEEEEMERNRGLLLVLATLAAPVTYAAGLNPPGGFWPSDNKPYHLAGDPVMRDHYPRRFNAFLMCNTTAFAGSLVIIIMLLSNTAANHVVKSYALRMCVLVSLFGLMGAYAAGSCRKVHTSIYVFALVGAVLLYLFIQWVVSIDSILWWIKKKQGTPSSMPENGNSNVENMVSDSGTQNSVSSRVSSTANGDKDDMQKLRTYLLLLGILAATVTYQAGLSPPGGFWQDSVDGPDGHLAGNPILESMNPKRYKAFFYCNATAFVASLVIIIMLQSQLITVGAMKRHILQTAMTFDLFGLMGAYAAGSCRKLSTSVYVFVLVLLVFIYVVLHVLLFVALKTPLEGTIDSLSKLFSRFTNHSGMNEQEEKDLKKRRKFLMLLAILVASITYQSGINPPGGFWSDNNGHRAGDPVFRDEFPRRYRIFFYSNATAFMASLAVIMLLVSKRLCHKGLKTYALRLCVLVDLTSLMVAFSAGNCRKVSTSMYVILVVAAVLAYVIIQVLVLSFAKVAKVDLDDILKQFTYDITSSVRDKKQPSVNQEGSDRAKTREHKWRKDLMLIGTLAVTVTYQSGLLPPGGLWPSDKDHFAGDPILKDTNPTRYKVFFYCNATAFMASMVMVILLLNNTISKYKRSLLAMKTAIVLDLLSLLGAYAAGSCRKLKTSAYIFALVIAVCIYIAIHVLLSFHKVAILVKRKGEEWMPCLKLWSLIETEASPNQRSSEV